jgi:hypothetical protein
LLIYISLATLQQFQQKVKTTLQHSNLTTFQQKEVALAQILHTT